MKETALAVSSASVEIDPEKLRESRQDCGYTQLQLGKLAGLTGKYISQLECGYRIRVSPPAFVALCNALRIPQSRRRILRKSRPERLAA